MLSSGLEVANLFAVTNLANLYTLTRRIAPSAKILIPDPWYHLAPWTLFFTLVRQEYGDEQHSSISHNTGDEQDSSSAFPITSADNTDYSDHHDRLGATGESACYPITSAEHKGGGHQYTQGEWDHHNAEHGAQHSGALTTAPSSVFSDEGPAYSSAGTTHSHQASTQPLPSPGTTPEDEHQPEQQDENSIGRSDSSFGDIGGGERQAAMQEGVSDDSIQGELDAYGENTSVTPSSAAEVAATEEGCGADGKIDDGVVGRQEKQQQQRQREGQELDDLYDIDDHGLSSSDDD